MNQQIDYLEQMPEAKAAAMHLQGIDPAFVSTGSQVELRSFQFPAIYKQRGPERGVKDLGSRPTKAVIPVTAELLTLLGVDNETVWDGVIQQEIDGLVGRSSLDDTALLLLAWNRNQLKDFTGTDKRGVFVKVRRYRNNQNSRILAKSRPEVMREVEDWVSSAVANSNVFNGRRQRAFGLTPIQFTHSAVESIIRLSERL